MPRNPEVHGYFKGHIKPVFKTKANFPDAGAIEDIPFVTGVMADLSVGQPHKMLPVESRSFIDIDADNFDARMAEIQPSVSFYVSNELTHDGTVIDIELKFSAMSDFEPEEVARRIPELAVLLEAREQLKSMVAASERQGGADLAIQALLREACKRLAHPAPAWTNSPRSKESSTQEGPQP